MNVFDGDGTNAFDHHRSKINLCAEGDGGEQSQFMGRINATHIKVWICFEISQTIGLGKDFLIGQAGIFHAREDIVAAAIHDSEHALNFIACKAFGQCFHHGDTPGNGGLIADDTAGSFGREGQ